MDGAYSGADLELGRRGSSAIAIVAGGLSLMLFAFAPPTHGVGPAGWAIGGLLVFATLLPGLALTRPGTTTSFRRLAVLQWSGLAALTALVWLTGGRDSPQIALIVLWMVAVAALHPARQTALYVGVAALATAAPLAYDGTTLSGAGEVLARLVPWIFLAGVANNFMSGVRRDRLDRERSSLGAAELARVDQLTGLGNRRAFDETLRSMVDRSRDTGAPVSVLVADIHRFKTINDSFGHIVGDRCLQEVAATLSDSTRRVDRTYRWGGDEFAVLLPSATHEDAEALAARVGEAVERRCTDPEGTGLQLGCGCSQLDWDMDAEALLAAADLDLMTYKGGDTGQRFILEDAV